MSPSAPRVASSFLAALILATLGLAPAPLGAEGGLVLERSHRVLGSGGRCLVVPHPRQDLPLTRYRLSMREAAAGTLGAAGDVALYTAPTVDRPTWFTLQAADTGHWAPDHMGATGSAPIRVLPGPAPSTLLGTGWMATLPALAALCQGAGAASPAAIEGINHIRWVEDPAMGALNQHWLVAHQHGISAVSPSGTCREVLRTAGPVVALATRPAGSAADNPLHVVFAIGMLDRSPVPGANGALADLAFAQLFSLDGQGQCRLLAGSLDPGATYRDGPAAQATFGMPTGLAIGTDGSVYVADFCNRSLRALAPDGQVHTLVGSQPGAWVQNRQLHFYDGEPVYDGPAATATFAELGGLDFDPARNCLYVCDLSTIRRVSLTGTVTTILGHPRATQGDPQDRFIALGAAALETPEDVQVRNNHLYIADRVSHGVRLFNLSSRRLTTLAGMLPVPAIRSGPLPAPPSRMNPSARGNVASPYALALNPQGLCLVGMERGSAVLDLSRLQERIGLWPEAPTKAPQAHALPPTGRPRYPAQPQAWRQLAPPKPLEAKTQDRTPELK